MKTDICTLVDDENAAAVARIYSEAHRLLSLLTPSQISSALPVLYRLAEVPPPPAADRHPPPPAAPRLVIHWPAATGASRRHA